MTRAKALRLDDLDLALEPFLLRGRNSGGNEALFFIALAGAMLLLAALV